MKDLKKKKFEMPSSICILIILTIVLAILTHLIPAGEYTRVDNVPIAGTYTQVNSNPQGIWDVLSAPMQGFRGAIDIILFVFVLSGCLGIIGKSRSLDAGLMYVINRLNGREKLMIPIVMFIASIGGTTFGFSEETIPFYPILIPMFIAMGYDAVTACMVLFLGSGAGIVGALINPFSVGIGSDIAGISLADGMLIRVVIYIATVTSAILFTMHYAEKVRRDPSKSVVYDIHEEIESHIHKLGTDDIPEFTRQRKGILTVFAASFIVMILAIIPWSSKFNIYVFDNIHENLCQIPLVGRLIGNMQPLGGWGMKELTVIFLLAAIIIGKMSHMKEKEMISLFVGGCQNILDIRKQRPAQRLIRGHAPRGILPRQAKLLHADAGNDPCEVKQSESGQLWQQAGQPFAASLRQRTSCPGLLVELLMAGETTGTLDAMMEKAAAFAAADVRHRSARVEALAEPIMIFFVGGLIFFFVLSIVLPLLTTMDALM